MGRPSFGVAAQQVPDDERCVALSVVTPADRAGEVVTLDRAGGGKRSPLDDYPTQRRGGKGVVTGTTQLVWCGAATAVHAATAEGPQVIRGVQLERASRGARTVPTLPAITARVVPEQHADGLR
jgi:DNA gyrase/topoisomerase IV subunit A